MENFDPLEELNLPGVPTGEILGAEGGWRSPNQQTLGSLLDKQEVMVLRGNKQSRVKFDKATGSFYTEKEVVDRMADVGVYPSMGTGMGGIQRAPVMKTVRETVDPASVDAFNTGPDAMETAVKSAIRSTPGTVVGTGAFMAGMGAGSAPFGGPETPLGFAAGTLTGIGSSMLASAAVEKLMTEGFNIKPDEREQIGMQLNPMAATIGGFAPTLLMFRPSGSLLKTAAGFEDDVFKKASEAIAKRDAASKLGFAPNLTAAENAAIGRAANITAGLEAAPMTQAQALSAIAKGGLMNMGIAQASSMADAAVYGSRTDPNVSKLDAVGRAFLFGNVEEQGGGGIGDRLAHAGKEFAIGAGALHKPWALGKPFHNIAHPTKGQVKFSGAPTFEALQAQRVEVERANRIRDAIAAQETARVVAAQNNPVVAKDRETGIEQVKAKLAESLKSGLITQGEHDQAVQIATTLGEEILRNTQLSQVGGGAERETIEGSAGPSIDPSNPKGVINSVNIFTRALRRGVLGETLVHEVLHPIYESLSPDMRAKLIQDLVRERASYRSSNKPFDALLKLLKVDNGGDWQALADRQFSADEMSFIAKTLKDAGHIKSEEDLYSSKGMFVYSPDGTFKLRNNLSGTGEKIARRLWSVREFLSVEGSRLAMNRGKYDPKWGGITDAKTIGVLNAMYRTIRAWIAKSHAFIQTKMGRRMTIDQILDHISSGTIKDIVSDPSNVVPGDAMSAERVAENDAINPSVGVDMKAIGDILSKGAEQVSAERQKQAKAEPTAVPGETDQGRPSSQDVADLIANIQIKGSQNRRSAAELESQLSAIDKVAPVVEMKELPELNYSEGDVDPANPPAAKGTDEMLAKIGIKRTVAPNIIQHRKIGSIEGFAVMDTPEKVTHAFRNMSRMSQESIQLLITDKNHKPLEIIRHTMSEPGASGLSSLAMATQVSSVKGAAHVWITHNHPSGTPAFSSADVTTGYALVTQIFKGMGVKPMGFFAQSGENISTYMEGTGSHGGNRTSQIPAPGEASKKIPIVERRFEFKRGTGKDFMEGKPIGTYSEARDFAARTIGNKPGVIFLDKYDRPVGTHELRFTDDGALGRAGARELAGAFSRTGAEKVVVTTGDARPDVQEAIANNVTGMFQQIKNRARNNPVKMVVSMDSPNKTDLSLVNMRIQSLSLGSNWRSEGDAEGSFPNRQEFESRVGATTIKPLHAAPNVKFPIPAEKLKKFGIDRGHVNQFSEHAVVGKVESPVSTVTNHEEAAMFIDDYAGHIVQGQTMILITDKNGKPLQVGLHMINPDTATDKIMKPMMGVLAGQAVSTPGAHEAWFVRINNGEYGGLGRFRYDDALNNIDALRNLLDGTGITFRGALSISDGRYSFNPLESFDAKAGMGTSIDDLTVTNKQIPISTSGGKHTFKITERRYSSRTQVSYKEGEQRPDAMGPNPARGKTVSSEAWNRAIEEQLGKKSGLVFNANSGAITAVYPMTLAEMQNIRGSKAQRAILALADRSGTNWVTIHMGDQDRSVPGVIKDMKLARENVGRFLSQANLKADTVMFRDANGQVQELDGVFDNRVIDSSLMDWKSEGDQDVAMPGDSFPDVPSSKANTIGFKDGQRTETLQPSVSIGGYDDRARTTPYANFTKAMVDKLGLKVGRIDMSVGNARTVKNKDGYDEIVGSGTSKILAKHTVDFERDFGADFESKLFPGQNMTKQQAIEFIIQASLQNANIEGFSRFGSATQGGYRSTQNNRLTVLSHFRGVPMEIVLDTESMVKGKPDDANELITAYPIDKRRADLIRSSEKYVSNSRTDMRQARLSELRKSQAASGLEMPGLVKSAEGRLDPAPSADMLVRQKGSVVGERGRGMKNPRNFSEGDAQEFSDRAKRAIEQDDVIGPEAIRGNFLGWVKSIKELADKHLYQHPFPGNSGDYEGDIARDKDRLAKHAIIDQVLAKLERQKGFNPMTLKPGMLKQLRDIAGIVYTTEFSEIARTGVVMIEHIQDDLPRRHVEFMRNASLDYHKGFIKQIYTGMEAGMISKRTGMQLIDMANDMRSSIVYSFDKKFPGDGTRMSEGDAENMMIPGGSREAAMNARPKKQVKTYLNIGHGNIEGAYGNAEYVGGFKPEDTFLYMYDHNKGKFTVQNVADMANNENVKVTRPDDFAHGMGGNGIETGIGLKSRQTGVNGRIEIDHENKTILVSAGQGRGKLDAWSARGEEMMKRSDALKEVRSYVEAMQKKGELPAGYKIEGYGFPGPYERESLGYEPGFQERFSEGDVDLKTPNHQDKSLEGRGFITKYVAENLGPRLRDKVKIDITDEDGNAMGSVNDMNRIRENHFVMRVGDVNHPASLLGELVFSLNLRTKRAYFEFANVYGTAQNKGLLKAMYAEIGERLRRMGINTIDGYVIDELKRPILARKAVFGEDSTKYKVDTYIDEETGKKMFSGADVRTEIDPDRRLSEGDIERPNPDNPKTNDGEIANHTDAQLAKRGFITLVAKENARSMAGMKMTIQQKGYTKAGSPTYLPKVEGSIEGAEIDGMGEFHGKIEYNGENGLQKVADFIYKVMPGAAVSDGTGDLDWIKVQPIWRNRNISTVIVAEVVERIRRSYGGDMSAFVVDPDGRPIRAINRVLGKENVDVYDNGFEETSPRDQFAQRTPDGEYLRRSWDVNGKINPKKLYSEGDDGENMRIPGGARDRFRRDVAGVKRPKPIQFWTDVGHADKTDMEGEQNTYLWYATKKGDIQVISADELRNAHSPEGYQLIDSDDIPTHADWETHLNMGNIQGDFGKQPINDLPHGRIDDRGDVTRISYMDHHRAGRTDYEHLRDEIKKKLADYMGKKADEMPGYDFTSTVTRGTGPDRFSEGDSENGRFPNQVRARGKIPNARVNNGETDLGFTLGPGEQLDSRGGIIRNRNTSNLGWGDIGHEPLQYKGDMFGEDIGKPPEKLIRDLEDAGQLQTDINFENGLFAYDASKGVFIHDTDMNRSSHAGWLGIPSGQELIVPGKSGLNSDFGVIPSKYSYLGRIEPAIVTKDGTVERRGRISLGRNIEGKSWLEDSHEMRRGEFPPDFLTKLKQEAAKQGYELVDYKGEGITEKQIHTPDMYDVYGFGMKKDKAEMGISRKDFGPIKMSEGDAETMRDVATRPIGEGKDGQARLKAIAARMSEGDMEVGEPPFRIPKVAPGKTNLELAKDIVTARFFTGISTKAHEIAADFPTSRTAMEIANMIHARTGSRGGVTQLDLPTAIMKERTRVMNRFFEIMDPLRGDFASMTRDARETAYREFADMVTGLRPIDSSTAAGRAADGLKALLREMHDYRTAAGEKLGEVADYFPAVYDSIRISEDAMAFKDDAKRAYMLELANEFQGDELDAAAEKAARELTMSHIRGESAGMFNSFFEEAGPSMGENSSKSRTFGPEAQEILSKWQVKDPYRIISRYIAGATKRAELVRRLGDEGQTWRRMAKAMENEGVSYEKIDEMRDLLKASVGIGREPNSRGEQTFIDLMGLYTAGSVMGRSFLNNMFEPASMGIRSGNLSLGLQAYGETWGRTIRNAARTLSGERIDKSFWERYAEQIGTISADVNDAWMNSHSIEVDGDRSDPRINWLTSKVYQSNLLQLTENAKLQASHAIGFRYLLNLAEMQQGRSFMNRLDVTESVRQNLRELGIEDADHGDFARWMLRLDGMDDAARMRTMLSGGRMSKLFETAMTKFSMQSSVRANRAHKPMFQDGPIGKTLFQLMSYSYSYAAEINSRAYDYARNSLKSAPAGKSYGVGDRVRFIAPLMMAPLGIIAFRAMFALKDELYPTEYSKKHENDPAWTKWLNAASFAGIFGPKVEMAAKYVMRDQPPGGPAGQAVIGYARAAKTAIANAMEDKPQDNAKRQFAKASVQPLKAAGVIGATAFHPVAGAIASQVANTTGWSNAMTEPDKNEATEKRKRK